MQRLAGWTVAGILAMGLLSIPMALGDGGPDPDPRVESCEYCGEDPCVCPCSVCGEAGVQHGLRENCGNEKYTCEDCDCCICTKHDWKDPGPLEQSDDVCTMRISPLPENGKRLNSVGPGKWTFSVTMDNRPRLVYDENEYTYLEPVPESDKDIYEWSPDDCECDEDALAPCVGALITDGDSFDFHRHTPGTSDISVTYSRKEAHRLKPIIRCKVCNAEKQGVKPIEKANNYDAKLVGGPSKVRVMKVELSAPSPEGKPGSTGAGNVGSKKHWTTVSASLSPKPEKDFIYSINLSRVAPDDSAYFIAPHNARSGRDMVINTMGGGIPPCPDKDNPNHNGDECGYRLVSSRKMGLATVTASAGGTSESGQIEFAWPTENPWNPASAALGNRNREIRVSIGLDQHPLEFVVIGASGYQWNAAEERYDSFTTTGRAGEVPLSSCASFVRNEDNDGGPNVTTDQNGGAKTWLRPTVSRDLVVTNVSYRVWDRQVYLP